MCGPWEGAGYAGPGRTGLGGPGSLHRFVLNVGRIPMASRAKRLREPFFRFMAKCMLEGSMTSTSWNSPTRERVGQGFRR